MKKGGLFIKMATVCVLIVLNTATCTWLTATYHTDLSPPQLIAIIALSIFISINLFWIHIFTPLKEISHSIKKLDDEKFESTSAYILSTSDIDDRISYFLKNSESSALLQNKFLADASHQLKTPFAVLKAQVQGMIAEQLNAEETLLKMLQTINKSSMLVDQMLSMAKVEKITQHPAHETIDISHVAKEVVLDLSPLFAAKDIEMVIEVESIELQMDRWLIAELLKNLLSNAIHHTPAEGQIGLVIRKLLNEVEILVWDTGGGLNPEIKDRLFQPFQTTSKTNGVGLGLSICRRIAESLGAEINIYDRIDEQIVIGVDATVRWKL